MTFSFRSASTLRPALARYVGSRGFDRGEQLEVVLQMLQRWQEDIQQAALAAVFLLGFRAVGALRVAHLDAQRGAGQPAGRFLRAGG